MEQHILSEFQKNKKTPTGLKYIVNENTCMLCEREINENNAFSHINAHGHREKYLETHLPSILEILKLNPKYDADNDYKTKALSATARKLDELFPSCLNLIRNTSDQFDESRLLETYKNEFENIECQFLPEDAENLVPRSKRKNYTKHERNDKKVHEYRKITQKQIGEFSGSSHSMHHKTLAAVADKEHLLKNCSTLPSDWKKDCLLMKDGIVAYSNHDLKDFSVFIQDFAENIERNPKELFATENINTLKKIRNKLKAPVDFPENGERSIKLTRETVIDLINKCVRNSKLVRKIYRGPFVKSKVEGKVKNTHLHVNFEKHVTIELFLQIGYKSTLEEMQQYQYNKVNEFMGKWSQGRIVIFTDAAESKDKDAVSCAFWDPMKNCAGKWKFRFLCFIDTGELHGIFKVLKYSDSKGLRRILILTDSKSSCEKIKRQSKDEEIGETMKEILSLIIKVDALIAWIPSHFGIEGNEKADELARDALNNENTVPNQILIDDEESLKFLTED